MLRKLLSSFLLLSTVGASAQQDSLIAGIQDIAWSPDGQYIYCSVLWHNRDWSDFAPHKWKVHRFHIRSKVDTVVADSAYTVAVAANGYRIAVGKLRNGKRNIWSMDADGRHARPVSTNPTDDYSPSWSPDGMALVYNATIDGKVEICRIRVDGSGYQRLTVSKGDNAHSPSWSPRDDRVVYYAANGDNKDQVHVMRADGTNDHNLTNDTLSNTFPAWADADARTIIYSHSAKKGEPMAYTMDAEGKKKEPLGDVRSFYSRLSPDGKQIACIDKVGLVRIIDRATGGQVAELRPMH
ncbi:MAG: DUF5050 domain-containing protein [Flavobacteriales bacterium]